MADVPIAEQLSRLLEEAGLATVGRDLVGKFETYLGLLVRWNARMNLTAVRDQEGILSRHFMESIECAQHLPQGIKTLLDFGSGAGFPGIPIALCHPEIAVTLAESQGKKAAFLREAVRTLGIDAIVRSGRAEALAKQFDCVTLRAVDKMEQAVRIASRLVARNGWIILMTTETEWEHLQSCIEPAFGPVTRHPLRRSKNRILAVSQKSAGDESRSELAAR